MKKLRYACLGACYVLKMRCIRAYQEAVTRKTSFVKPIFNRTDGVGSNYWVDISSSQQASTFTFLKTQNCQSIVRLLRNIFVSADAGVRFCGRMIIKNPAASCAVM